jgi:hypothetical protein
MVCLGKMVVVYLYKQDTESFCLSIHTQMLYKMESLRARRSPKATVLSLMGISTPLQMQTSLTKNSLLLWLHSFFCIKIILTLKKAYVGVV